MELPIRHTIRHRVGYAETDRMGVVHHSHHVVWFERARIELLRAVGANYRALEERGVMLPVREMRVRYHHPARFDNELEIEATLAEMRGARCRFRYAVHRLVDGRRLADAEVELVFCDLEGRPVRHGPETIRAMIEESRGQ
jgi:acyl-CoA thioester hydrolase